MTNFYNIAIRSEYSFHNSFAPIKDIVKIDADCIGIADDNNTFGFIPFAKAMKAAGKKPLFGVRLEVFEEMQERFSNRFPIVLIAKNNDGLKEMYKLVSTAWEQFFWQPRLSLDDFDSITHNIFMIGGKHCDYSICNFSQSSNSEPVYVDDNNYLNLVDRDVYQLIAGSSKRGEERNYNFNSLSSPLFKSLTFNFPVFTSSSPITITLGIWRLSAFLI